MAYRIGIDVGERSVGFSAVDYDDDGWPIDLLATVSHIHDGGMDPDTGKSPQSRLATAGVARRTRRLVRNRRKRLAVLDEALSKHGFPVPAGEVPQTHDAWHARARLSTNYVSDDAERARLVSLAARHIARHRGWRNPWWSYLRLSEASSPSEHLARTLAAAADRFGDSVKGCTTAGQLVSRVASSGAPIRPTKKAQENPLGRVLADQVRQEDSLAELRLILDTQQVSRTTADDICAAVFLQAKPHIPTKRIGRCDLQPDQLRAPIATLEFQEFRIRSAVGNLRIGRRDKEPLNTEQVDSAVEFLMMWREDQKPRWRDVAEHLGVSARDLVDSSVDGSGSSVAPHDRTSSYVEGKYRKSSPIGEWWLDSDESLRAEFVDMVTDLSGEQVETPSESLALLLAQDQTVEEIERLNNGIESGRASYSRDTLRKLNDVMREYRCGLHDARKIAFEFVTDDWKPTPPSLDDPIEHPTVARINVLVRRFLSTAVTRWGMPDRVVVEHVRDAFMGPAALAELKREITSNTRKREVIAETLKSQNLPNPRRSDIRRNDCVERQNCVCLYCGKTISFLTCELDHIVPRARGGSSRRDNLVAVCRECNSSKGKLPFAVFAEHSKNPAISVELAQARVRDWARSGSLKSFRRFQADVQRRLVLREDDEIDERSMASTAYAAREMRARIESFLDAEAAKLEVTRGEVVVLSGIATSEARKAGGVDDRLRLREFTRKSRFDRRHHAIDAAVLTSLDLNIARTLKDRANLKRDNDLTRKYPEWKEYRGSSETERARTSEWCERIDVLAGLLEAAIRSDRNRIPVVRPLRLSPRVGAVHADTIQPLVRKSISDEFSADELQRIVDRGLYGKLNGLAEGQPLLPDDGRATLVKWPANRPVELFPSTAAYLAVRGGAAKIGDTIYGARVFAWRRRDDFEYGMIRMFAGEFAKIGLAGPRIDIFSAPLPPHSMAMRTANPTLKARINAGEARQIGWLAIDDEFEFNPQPHIQGENEFARFLRISPEQHWYICGLEDGRRVNLRPMLLAREGLPDDAGPELRRMLETKPARLSINDLCRLTDACIVRRTITGAPRWQPGGLPTSWNVREAAERVFGS